jgi:hypothetical protein
MEKGKKMEGIEKCIKQMMHQKSVYYNIDACT